MAIHYCVLWSGRIFVAGRLGKPRSGDERVGAAGSGDTVWFSVVVSLGGGEGRYCMSKWKDEDGRTAVEWHSHTANDCLRGVDVRPLDLLEYTRPGPKISFYK